MILKFDDFINSQKCNESFDPSILQITALLLTVTLPTIPFFFRKNIKVLANKLSKSTYYFSNAYTFSKLIFKYKDEVLESNKYPMLKSILNGNIWKKSSLRKNDYYKSWKNKAIRNDELYNSIMMDGLENEIKELMSYDDYLSFISLRKSTFDTAMEIRNGMNESKVSSETEVSDTDKLIMLFTFGQGAFILDKENMVTLKRLLDKDKNCRECMDKMEKTLLKYKEDFPEDMTDKLYKTMNLEKAEKSLDALYSKCKKIMSKEDFGDFIEMIMKLHEAMESVDDNQSASDMSVADMDEDDLGEIFDEKED